MDSFLEYIGGQKWNTLPPVIEYMERHSNSHHNMHLLCH